MVRQWFANVKGVCLVGFIVGSPLMIYDFIFKKEFQIARMRTNKKSTL
jgi:hypothetical protein